MDEPFEVVGDLARRKQVIPAFDCIEVQPCIFDSKECGVVKSKSHGRGAERIYYDLLGPTGGVTFDYFTDRYHEATPQRVQQGASAGAITFHYLEPPHDFASHSKCDLLPEGECWADVGYLIAEVPFQLLREEGEEAMWRHLATLLPETP